MAMDWMIIGLSAFLSLLLPVAIICIRQTVKAQRRDVIQDLQRIFELQDPNTNAGKTETCRERDLIVPSFEFVKFKYFSRGSPTSDVESKDTPIWAFIITSFPLVLSLFILGLVTFGPLLANRADDRWQVYYLSLLSNRGEYPLWLTVLMVAYSGAYLYTVRVLLRAVSNFDLTPATFLSSTVHVLMGAASALLVALTFEQIGKPAQATAAVLIAAFVIGFIPDLGLRAVLRATTLNLFKREDTDVLKAYASTPLEVIDGIDTEIRARLADCHIATVQNLATANPIKLFVETPYGVYQIIDWVAQAQLCLVVGPKGLTQMWKLGIRTIFDLERAVLDEGFTAPRLRHAIGQIMTMNTNASESLDFGQNSTPSEEADEIVVALANVALEDLHVQRLRQIVNRIAERLDLKNLELFRVKPRNPTTCRLSLEREDSETRQAAA